MHLHPNDIPVLAKIFNPEGKYIFIITKESDRIIYKDIANTSDCNIQFFSEERGLAEAICNEADKAGTVINLMSKAVDMTLAEKSISLLVISFSEPKNSPNTKQWQFSYINNTDNTIRWIYASKQTKPLFLNVYNSAGWKGKVFKNIFKISFQLRLQKYLASGHFWVSAKDLFLEETRRQLINAQYAIFTGTVGENRKAVITFEENNQSSKFLKMPLTHQAKHLVQNEALQLKTLQTFTFHKLVVPKAEMVGSNLMLSNICPKKYLKNEHLEDIHLFALDELYHQTTSSIIIADSKAWKDIQNDISKLQTTKIQNDLSKEKILHLVSLLTRLYEQFDPLQKTPMAIAHGDFTPWNSYLSPNKLHVYDWELAMQLPLLYDAFHYVFQTSILVKKSSFANIKKQVDLLIKKNIIQRMIKEFEINWRQSYRFYLLRNTSYYVSRYIQQTHLHQQVHWLVDSWTAALEDCLKTQ